jgi:hypothetical protein
MGLGGFRKGMRDNWYNQEAPREKGDGKLNQVIVEGMVVPGSFTGETAREESLQMVMDQEDIQIILSTLMPQGNEPGKSHEKEDKGAKPEPHFENFLDISVGHEKGENAKSRNHNTDETLCEEGEATGNIHEHVTQKFFSGVVRQVADNKKTHTGDNKEGKGAVHYDSVGDPEILPGSCQDEGRKKSDPWPKEEVGHEEND